MSHIHFIGGEKGGVGKSLVSRILAQYLIDHERPFLGFDTDKSHGALMRFYAGYASPIVVDRYESLDAIVEAAAEQPDRSILVDLAAQTQDALTQWMDESGLAYLQTEAGLGLVHTLDTGVLADAIEAGLPEPQAIARAELPARFGFVLSPQALVESA